jgi:hypothetical protein
MRKSKSFFMLFVFAVLFLAASAAFAISETWASEAGAQTGQVGNYAEGKVVPPGWCLEHGYIARWNPDDPYVCILCD